MKYGSYLVEGESARGFYAVRVIHVTAQWARDRHDCLWDGVGMRNHHKGNVFVLPVLICTLTCSSVDGMLMHTRAHALLNVQEQVDDVCLTLGDSEWKEHGRGLNELLLTLGMRLLCQSLLTQPSLSNLKPTGPDIRELVPMKADCSVVQHRLCLCQEAAPEQTTNNKANDQLAFMFFEIAFHTARSALKSVHVIQN